MKSNQLLVDFDTTLTNGEQLMDYTQLKDYNLQTDFIDKLTDDEKKKFYLSLCDNYQEVDDLELDYENDVVEWVTKYSLDFITDECEMCDITFIATITFKEHISKEVFDKIEECEGCYSLDFEAKQVKFLPDFAPMCFPEEANLDAFWWFCEKCFELSSIDYFAIGDG